VPPGGPIPPRGGEQHPGTGPEHPPPPAPPRPTDRIFRRVFDVLDVLAWFGSLDAGQTSGRAAVLGLAQFQ
jgi:hypothetical protein